MRRALLRKDFSPKLLELEHENFRWLENSVIEIGINLFLQPSKMKINPRIQTGRPFIQYRFGRSYAPASLEPRKKETKEKLINLKSLHPDAAPTCQNCAAR